MPRFTIHADYEPTGDQPRAIEELVDGIDKDVEHQVLLGVTGSGKTFTMAHVVERTQRPALVLAPNKTLAAQLYQEFSDLFPENAVEYFVSYYDYYQPEAYVPSSDTYIEKDSLINDTIDRLRLSATRSLFERNDVLIVASVSCIYGLGSAEAYYGMLVMVHEGEELDRDDFLRRLVRIQYKRNDYDFHRGTFRVRGDVVEVFPAYEELEAVRITFFGDEVETIETFDPLRGKTSERLEKIAIYPGSHYVVQPERKKAAIDAIKRELKERLADLRAQNRLLEAQRLEQRTVFDLEMLETIGHCKGIENYSRHLTGRGPGEPPPCLLDYFPDDWLLFVDESHVAIPQVGAMFRGDRSRKSNLVDYGFRLPSALDNRPLKFAEFEEIVRRAIYVSATPGDYELDQARGVVVEQLIRPTGIPDPVVEVRPASNQLDDLVGEIRKHVDEMGDRVLCTTLTKRMAEDLTDYLVEIGIRARYLHSDIDTLERMDLLRDLRKGTFDVLVGINLLREGLDLPEVSLVAVLDADKEGFLRSSRSLIQTAGRAARNIDGRILLYADKVTGSMQTCIDETLRRRRIQLAYNEEHDITPRSIVKPIHEMRTPEEEPAPSVRRGGKRRRRSLTRSPAEVVAEWFEEQTIEELETKVKALREEMRAAAKELEFERAAELRDQLRELERRLLALA